MIHSGHAIGLSQDIDPSWRIGIVAASFYPEETAALVAGAREALIGAGIPPEQVTEHAAAGSFEVPLIGSVLAQSGLVDALIGIGIIVEGETHHARLLAEAAARGIMDVQIGTGIPFAFEILYVNDLAQARERATGEGNKGQEAAYAVLHSLSEIKRVQG